MTVAMLFLPQEAVTEPHQDTSKRSFGVCFGQDLLTDYTESWEHFWHSWEHFWHSPDVQRVLPLPMQTSYRKRTQEFEANKDWYRPLDPVPSDEEAKTVIRLRQLKKRGKKQIQLDLQQPPFMDSPINTVRTPEMACI
jgi:hypothetical protein